MSKTHSIYSTTISINSGRREEKSEAGWHWQYLVGKLCLRVRSPCIEFNRSLLGLVVFSSSRLPSKTTKTLKNKKAFGFAKFE